MAVNVVSFSFSRCSTGGPAAQLSAWWWLSLLHLISNFSGPQTPSGFPRAPSSISSISVSNSNWDSNSTATGTRTGLTSELYNSSTPTRSPTQSPTRSLKSHVWSSSSGNNCHAVHWSLSSGASVYGCTMGIFSLSHFVSQFPPTRFPLLTAIGMCHFLPVHHLEWHFWPGRRSKYNSSLFSHLWACVRMRLISIYISEQVLSLSLSLYIYIYIYLWVCVYIYIW